MNRLKRRWFPKKPNCDSGVSDFMTVGLQEIKPALYLLVAGTLFSLLLMFVEIFVYKIIQRWKSNQDQERFFRSYTRIKVES